MHPTPAAALSAGDEFALYRETLHGQRVHLSLHAPLGYPSGCLHLVYLDLPPDTIGRFVAMPLCDIRQLHMGKQHGDGWPASVDEGRCMSVGSPSATWKLVANRPGVCQLWVSSIRQLLPSKTEHCSSSNGSSHGSSNDSSNSSGGSSSSSSASSATPISAAVRTPPRSIAAPGAARHLVSRLLPNQHRSHQLTRTLTISDAKDCFIFQCKIGEGSFGAVYKALDLRDHTEVAIKILPAEGHRSARLRKEIHILKECQSPFIVGYKGAFQRGSNVWIVMEHCAAGSLQDVMQACGHTFSEYQVAAIMRQCLEGLAYLHAQGRIHRDIKGGNILSDADGCCKLADFGVSGDVSAAVGKSRTVVGTPHWMAPEVLLQEDYNEKADVWSLGITAFELVLGEPPHATLSPLRAAVVIPSTPSPTLPQPEEWSDDFRSFLACCLHKKVSERWSASQLLDHPYIVSAPFPSVLSENVARSISTLKLLHQRIDGIPPTEVTNHGAHASGSRRKSGGRFSASGQKLKQPPLEARRSHMESGSSVATTVALNTDSAGDVEMRSSPMQTVHAARPLVL